MAILIKQQLGYKHIRLCKSNATKKVSIPHRQATNPDLSRFTRSNSVFQFLIGRLQTRDDSAWFESEISFNSSQVGYKRGITFLRIWGFLGFNSSQVGYKRLFVGQYVGPRLGFNSSQVGYKLQRLVEDNASNLFQFLIGRLQTNTAWPRRGLTGCPFQFLIGRLQTRRRILPHFCVESGFNSSQVGYKHTGKNNSEQLSHYRFQFLIGRLQTHQPACPHQRGGVSIPHRQATNAQRKRRMGSDASVSIPHRQATNHWHTQTIFYGHPFQFLIGRLQTHHDPFIFSMSICFNSSQVGYKHQGSENQGSKKKTFQFLIGRLQTGTRGSNRLPNSMFQFLIGRLQTHHHRFRFSPHHVSIPHRQATNTEHAVD